MIGGLNPNAVYRAQSDATALRERSDIARNSSAAGVNGTPEGIRQDLAVPRSEVGERATNPVDSAAIKRRVEARQASEDVRLERFRADDMPLASARALETFAGVAALRDDVDVELAGIDIRI
ncbi:UDP pyrophosphate phosphatase [Marinobacter caseinilyticus]|uniref:UDP pyrophosphate phosphatase n=1 Tax=Marinobacter caseinilyticus TaxID=2692195 RepID=UPI00140A46AD|nr:UDP pyrophosphate phosphatase [Marinobacter caseinilyticus]